MEIKIPLMTLEERNKYIADCCDGFKGQLLARADRIPRDWDCAEIQQWIMDTARDAWTVKMTPTRKHRSRLRRRIFTDLGKSVCIQISRSQLQQVPAKSLRNGESRTGRCALFRLRASGSQR